MVRGNYVLVASALLLFAACAKHSNGNCVDDCSQGAASCDVATGGVLSCTTGADGCMHWSSPSPCPTGQICNQGTCQLPCFPTCTPGTSICQGNATRSCEQQSNGCNGWQGTPVACANGEVCSGGICGGHCTNQCAAGSQQCSGAGFVVCVQSTGGCTDWANPTQCPAGQTCSGGQCVQTCQNQCTQGGTRCTTSGLVENCVMEASGCTDWTLGVACPAGQSCSGTSCASTCVPGQTQCNGNQALSCGSSGTWTATTCTTSQTCANGLCVNPTCAGGCSTPPGATCSDANTRVTYAPSGTCINNQCVYSPTQTACPFGCVQGGCLSATTCTPNALSCVGNQVEVCNANGSAWLFAQNCTGTCTNGLCDAPCQPAAIRCNGSTVETCNTAGTQWVPAATACAQGCLAGACLANQLVVDGQTVQMSGEYHYSTLVDVKNGGQIQVGPGLKLALYAPTINVEISSSITGTATSSPCQAPPDDVAQGIVLVADQITINGSVTWSGSGCSVDGIVIRADTINGSGTVSSTERSLLLYGTGGLAPGLGIAKAVTSLMPPQAITSVNYPAGATYNDDGPVPVFSWSRPYSTVAGYYYLVASAPGSVPTATSTLLSVEALALAAAPSPGNTYLEVVTMDVNGVVGVVPHEFEITVQAVPPGLTSSTDPTQGTYSANTSVVVAWGGGNPGLGYYYVFDNFPSTRPTVQTGTFEATNKNPAQVLLQNVAPGQWWFHMIALDSMGYPTKSASHYEIDVGQTPAPGTIAGTVTDSQGSGIVGAEVVVQRGLYTVKTTAGGVYTFGNTIPAGTYEVVAGAPGLQSADGGTGVQSVSMMLTTTATQTTDGTFVLPPGSGCPTCSDPCAGIACPSAVCTDGQTPPPWSATCYAGTCDIGYSTQTGGAVSSTCGLGAACNTSSQCASDNCSAGACTVWCEAAYDSCFNCNLGGCCSGNGTRYGEGSCCYCY
jgi:hypothetical protein